jgi:hypothetical protein
MEIKISGGQTRREFLERMEGSLMATGGRSGRSELPVGTDGTSEEDVGKLCGSSLYFSSRIFKPRTEVPEMVLVASRRM